MNHVSIWKKSVLGREIDGAKVLGQEIPGLLEDSGRGCQSVQWGAREKGQRVSWKPGMWGLWATVRTLAFTVGT